MSAEPTALDHHSEGETGARELTAPSRDPMKHLQPVFCWLRPGPEHDYLSVRTERRLSRAANLVGAGGAALFAWSTLAFYLHTHRLIGGAFLVEQMWVVIAYLIRRPARVASRRPGDWLFAFGGTFGGLLFRPVVGSPAWGVNAGLALQLVGLSICVWSFLVLGRSFGFVAADRGLVRRGPYAVVRHPIYASYLLLQSGYLLQSLSMRNALVLLFCCSLPAATWVGHGPRTACWPPASTTTPIAVRSVGDCSPASGSGWTLSWRGQASQLGQRRLASKYDSTELMHLDRSSPISSSVRVWSNAQKRRWKARLREPSSTELPR